MSLPAGLYRQRAADAKKRAAQAKDPSVKRAFEEVTAGWRVLAEQMEWIDSQRSTLARRAGVISPLLLSRRPTGFLRLVLGHGRIPTQIRRVGTLAISI